MRVQFGKVLLSPFLPSSLNAIEYVSITLVKIQVIDLCHLLLYNMFSLDLLVAQMSISIEPGVEVKVTIANA